MSTTETINAYYLSRLRGSDVLLCSAKTDDRHAIILSEAFLYRFRSN